MLHSRGLLQFAQFIFSEWFLLSCSSLNSILGIFLDVCRVKGVYTSHSFRIVAATIAATSEGVSVHVVQIFDHWSSDACKEYILGLESHIAAISS